MLRIYIRVYHLLALIFLHNWILLQGKCLILDILKGTIGLKYRDYEAKIQHQFKLLSLFPCQYLYLDKDDD
jgi:hypothetical protein